LKSSPPDRSLAGFVRRALAAIRVEVPWAHEELTRALGASSTTLVVDGEPARVRAGGPGEVAVIAGDGAADVRCVTSSRTIIDLIGGRDTLLEAVEADRVALFGGVDALLGWHRVLEIFLHGAVRARASEGLLDEFRGRVSEA
jgi:hypothetical protein